MMVDKNRMKLVIPALAENVGLARVAVATFASQLDFTLSAVEELRVAVSEAASNSVIHAYPGEAGDIRIEALIENEQLTVMIEDDGIGIEDVDAAREPSYSSDPERMGLGFAFMDSFSDRLMVESQVGQGTTVVMMKRPQSGSGLDGETDYAEIEGAHE